MLGSVLGPPFSGTLSELPESTEHPSVVFGSGFRGVQ